MGNWTGIEDNYLIRHMEDGEYSQIVIDTTAQDANDQHPGLTTDSDFVNLVTNVTPDRAGSAEDPSIDDPSKRTTNWLWPYQGMKVSPHYIDAAKTSEWGGNDYFKRHLLEIYFTDTDNFNPASQTNGDHLKDWCDGVAKSAAQLWGRYEGYGSNSHGNLFQYGGHDFYFTDTGNGTSGNEPTDSTMAYVNNIPYNPSATTNHDAFSGNPGYNGSLLNTSMLDWHYALNGQSENSHLIFVIRLGGDVLEWDGGLDYLNRRYYIMRLPKTAIKKVITDSDIAYLEYGWGSGNTKIKYVDHDGTTVEETNPAPLPASYRDDFGDDDEPGYQDEETTPAWYLQDFIVRIYAPTGYEMDDFPSGDLETEMGWPVWSELNNDSTLPNLHPDNEIDYISFTSNEINFNQNDINDFRPISHVWVDIDNIKYNVQSFYDFTHPDYQYTGAPNTVRLAFDLSEQHTTIGDEYISDYQWFSDHDSGYKFFVMRWGDESVTEEIMTDEELLGELLTNGSDEYTHYDIGDEVSYQYNEQGTYVIQAMVYSWIKHPDEEFIMACRWKRVNIWFNLNEGTLSTIDFQDLGSEQFTTIPWPKPGAIPIIGGISQDSKYYKSVDAAYEGGEFSLSDHSDVNRLKSARRNDELGDHLGQIDLEQARVFTAPYDMHDLLMIDPITDEGWRPYWEDSYWGGGYDQDGTSNNTERFPRPTGEEDELPDSSCIGTQYITTSPTRTLRDTCVIELNTGELIRGTVFDSSGIGNVGFVLGDYTVDKKSKTIKLTRDSSIDRPEKATKDKAI